jgi:hypothetical protein
MSRPRLRPSHVKPLLAAALLLLFAAHAAADVIQRDLRPPSRAGRLRTSDVSDPDTVWIGHVLTNTGLPGTPGGYGPFKIGRGPNLPGGGPGTSLNGVWTFDQLQAGETDSLMGWWPVICPFGSVGTSNKLDRERPFFGFDYGNQGNYVGNQGPTAGQRTFGVTGYWHRDGGSGQAPVPASGTNPVGVSWAPLAGSNSAWCGLRSHGDLSAQDDVARGGTGNWFNSSVLDFNGTNTGAQIGSTSTTGTDHNFPGYGSQWDQMLYRDVTLADNASFNIAFKYRTNMSTGAQVDPTSRTGWFDKDPLKTAAAADGNFISSSDAAVTASSPVDSFMVYIGVPVEPVTGSNNDFQASDGTLRDVYDVKRRWFSEVIAINRPYRELLSASGVRAAQTFSTNIAGGPGSIIQQILDAQAGAGGKVRLVFRVKTNRSADDEDNVTSLFSSGTAGAAIIDDVVVNAWAAATGDFESATSIDNSPGVAATDAWKSTGKPPGIYYHTHHLTEPGNALAYDDPCGAITAPNRFCNLTGKIFTPGDHDLNEKPGGVFGSNQQDRQDFLVSPTINLKSNAPGDYNGMGIDAEIADVSGDYNLFHDIYINLLDNPSTGNGMRYAWQSYPATQPNGVKCWGEVRKTITFFHFGGLRGCFQIFAGGAKASGNLVHSNASGIPDSIRVYIEHLARCFTTSLTSSECSPSDGPRAGLYFDNMSFALIDGASAPALGVIIWDLFNDAFPVNGTGKPPGTTAFDTTAAQVRTGFNTSPGNGTLFRHNIPGDSAIIAAVGDNQRMDLVFRILPGVGNYQQFGNRLTALRQVPTSTTAAVGNSSSSNFWESYLADAGVFGTGGNGVTGQAHDPDGVGPILPGTRWDHNRWNSARMDTVERNFFPCVEVNGNLANLRAGQYATQYHESDPKYATLGTPKNRCFVIVNNLQAGSSASNTTCGTAPYPPLWTSGAGTGFNPNEIPGQPGRTREYTKIIPDGQLTPGAHVEYFFRKSTVGVPLVFDMVPDTNIIFQAGEGNFDGHRWQQFGVLPDRWKDQAFAEGGNGMACMLVVDLGDRRGDELTWVSLADSIGLTRSHRRGAHNGWKARGDDDITVPVGGNDNISVRPHLGQPGTVWDFFQTKGGESNVPAGRVGSRGASRVNPGLADGKFSNHGPDGDMMRTYYRTLILLAGDLGATSIGPIADQTDNDIGLFQDFLTNSTPSGTTPRLFLAVGRDLVEGQDDPVNGHPTFFPTFFGATLRAIDYRLLSGNFNDAADFLPVPPINNTSPTLGVFNPCFFSNDVLDLNTAVSGVQVGSFYENVGGAGPYVSSVYAPATGGRIARTIVEGFRIGDVGTRHLLTSGGRRNHYLNLFTNLYATLNCGAMGAPVGVGDGPGGIQSWVSYLGLRSSNPMRSGEARIAFSLPKNDAVEINVYDVSGRKIRKVASRVFSGGREHVVIWDGRDDAGEKVPNGLYFYRLQTPSWSSQKKLTVLTD